MEGHREALRRRAVAEGKEEIAADEQDRRNRELKQGVDHGVRGDCNSCRICHEPWASSGGHRIWYAFRVTCASSCWDSQCADGKFWFLCLALPSKLKLSINMKQNTYSPVLI
jgi:hypothetical protein